MEIIIYFFRDTLSGPLYIVAVVLSIILIFACIGYLAEKSINSKKEKEKYQEVTLGPNDVVKNEAVQEVAVPLATEVPPVSTVNVTPQVVTPAVAPIPANPQPVTPTPVVNSTPTVVAVQEDLEKTVVLPKIEQPK